MTSPAPTIPFGAFSRKFATKDMTLIESRCNACGFIIVASALDRDLQIREAEHLAQCTTVTP